VVHDITMRKEHEHEIERLSRLYAALSHVNQTIVTLNNREELFAKICRGLVEIGKLRMAWVGWLDVKTRQVIPVAQCGDGMGYLSRVTIYADDRPEGQGPTGTAIREGRNYICNDFHHDPRTLMWRKMAEQAGFLSSASLLIRQGGVICGAITVYADEADFFKDKEIALLEEAAADISFALDNFVREAARRQAEIELRWKTAFLEAQVDSSLDGILVVDAQGKKILQNQRMGELWKIPPEIAGNTDDNVQVEFVTNRTKHPRVFADKVTYLNTHPDEISRDEVGLIDGTFLDRYSSPVRDQNGKYYGRIWNFRDITERKGTETALVESKRFLRSTLDALSAHIAILDEHGTIIAVNAAWKRFASENHLMGSECGVGKNYLQVCDAAAGKFSKEAPAAAGGIRAIIAGQQETFTLEYPCHSPKEKRWFTLRATRFADDGPVRVVVAHENITERKQAESLVQHSEERYRSLIDTARDAIFTVAPDGTFTTLNPAVEIMSGVSRAEWIGKLFAPMVHPGDLPLATEMVQRILKGEHTPVHELRGHPSLKRPAIMEMTLAAQKNEHGEIIGVLGIGRDITERKRTEESHARLATAVEQSAETIVITDPDGTIIYANPAFEKTTGYTRAEALGQNPSVLKSGKQSPEFYRQMWEVLLRGEVRHGHFINKRKDGKLFDEEATISPIRDVKGKVINYVAVKRDVTHEMQLEAQFRQSQKMESIGTLAGGVAHDFNNILAVIQMQAGMLIGDGDLSVAQLELADGISSAVERAVGLTRQLLLFSRKQVLQTRDLDLNQNVTEMIKMLRRILGENIVVQLKLAAQPMLLHADAGMMDQVLMNLAVNARDAMLNGGQLVIETAGVEFDLFAAAQTAQARPGSFVCLSVSDTGCGIPPENLSKIFEPFFTTKGVGKGTGLGLATVFGIAQQHQGWVNVNSQVGYGTTFKVYLPRLSEAHDTKIIKKLLATAQTGHETILLVEDEPVLRTMIGKALTRLGYRVLEASTGFKALEVWKEHSAKIDLLLTDLMMPDGMTGRELGQRLLRENPKLRVIYMSGYSADIVAKDFPLQEGVNFLVKPFQSQKLAETLRDCLDNRSTA
jgi:PAS domain S-box-containing protein